MKANARAQAAFPHCSFKSFSNLFGFRALRSEFAGCESSPGHLMHGHRHTHHMSGCRAPPLVAVHGPGRVASEGPQNEGMALHAPRSKLSSSLVEAKDLKSCRSFEFPGGVPDIQLVCS